jgi:xanthine/CO dehydrogenase XdhC/CoxF family maturation factor
MSWLARTVDGIAEHGAVVRVTVVRADGSTPREVGAAMLVTAHAVHATIGGGALELAAIAHARSMLARSPLSPPPSGPPQSRAHPTDPEGDGERDGVRGNQGLSLSTGPSMYGPKA